MNQLRCLVVAGDSCVRGTYLDTCGGLSICHSGSGMVSLRGQIHLTDLQSTGCATICIPQVSSGNVRILATRRSAIRLGGCTNLLQVRAFDRACVDTRFMTSMDALVQAEGEALVTVVPFSSLRAFASGNSNIYYYTIPSRLLKHNLLSGNVFNMGCCTQACLCSFNRNY